jgi:uncharacterized membrane protein
MGCAASDRGGFQSNNGRANAANGGGTLNRPAGLLLGIGLGGFLDGIVLHQILQWHHMLSDEGCCPEGTIAGLEDNTVADGLFHLAAWAAVAVAVFLLWRGMRRGETLPGRVLAGLVLAGWGAFNLVEGVVDHHLLGLHHVKEGDGQLALDLGFLGLGALLVAVGAALSRSRPSALEP